MISGSQTVFMVHTSSVSVNDLTHLFEELAPSVEVHHIIDDSLLPEVLSNGEVTDGVRERMFTYYAAAEKAGADLIFNQCSSVGDVADAATELVNVPVVRVDRRMAERACELGKRIGVVATLQTTMDPTCRLIRRAASEMNKEIDIEECLSEGAFDLLISGDRPAHNRMVIESIKGLADRVDVIVCAQGSMIALLGDLDNENISTPILTSLRLGVEHAAEVLGSGVGVEPAQ